MTADPNDFDKLKVLLAWKRHEQPPPGFFNHLPDRIVSRIEADLVLRRRSLAERLLGFADFKPLLACSYGLAVGGILMWGLHFTTTDTDAESLATTHSAALWPSPAFATVSLPNPEPIPQTDPTTTGFTLANTPDSIYEAPSAQPLFDSPPAFLMNRGRSLHAQPVRFSR